jgi:uncharacterized OsmC-like protein
MTNPSPTLREFDVTARSTHTFGRIEVNARNHHFIVDGPAYNKCPGEELTPPEVFLASIAACGVELVEVIAKETDVPFTRASAKITGKVDRNQQTRPDVTVWNSIAIDFEIAGMSGAQAAALVEAFKRR